MDPESFFHVALKVDDLDRSVDFYTEHFDADIVDRGDAADGEGATAVNHVAMTIGDKRLYVFDQAPYEASADHPTVPTGVLHFGYVVDDVEAACGELAEGDVEFIMEPTEFGDLRIAFFEDPDGVRIELIEFLDHE